MRIFFQPERIGKIFNSGEYGKIVASIDFVGTKFVYFPITTISSDIVPSMVKLSGYSPSSFSLS